jgi:tetraacyldisaccharide 4'-kinase
MHGVSRPLEPAALTPPGSHYLELVSGRRRGPWAAAQRAGLSAAALPYGWAARLRNWLYDRGWKAACRALVPVVSVGNLTLGGTGKTPCVEHIARWYRDRGRRVAVLSRGYGSRGGRNDEALVLEENLPDVPHLQGANRAALARAAVEELESEVLVLDDGFQHRSLARDLDVVLIDATNPWGHGRLFPRGLLREPSGGLRRADLVLLTRCDQVPEEMRETLRARVNRLAPGVPLAETVHRPQELLDATGESTPLSVLAGRPVAAFCGLGNPVAFRQTLAGLGAEPIAFRVFADHHAYTRDDVEDLRAWVRVFPADTVVVTTQKDLVKLRLDQLGRRPLYALRIRLAVVSGQDALDHHLQAVLGPA